MTTEQKVTRKLSAILSADVKGYSLLMTNDEASTIKTLKEYKIIMSAIIKQHSGRVVDAPGDNLLAEFSSVVNAVQSSVEIQNKLKSRNAELPEDKQLIFRIGINIGDVVQDGDSLYGEGVNIAARIESLAEPGGVCISRGTYDHIRNKLGFGYEYLGEHSVKNIKHPVRVYNILMESEDAGKLIGVAPKPLVKNWIWATVVVATIILTLTGYQVFQKLTAPEFEPASIKKMALPLPDKPSIAVLAFDNISGDPEQEYFSDGISEDIITTLSKSDQIFVVARNSTFRYKGKPVDIKQVAEELGVRYVLEGSVRKSEDRVRVTAQLIDAVAGNHLWAERYDRDIKDIFALQDEITLKIVTALEVKLTEGEQVLTSRRYTNLDVKLKFMEVLSLWRKGTAASFTRHGQVAQEVIDMAPEFEGGYVHLGWHYQYLAMMGKSPRESISKAFKLAQKALSLNESDPFVYALLSYLYVMIHQYDKAIAEGEKGVALNPNGADNNWILGFVLGSAGKQDEAIGHFKQAIRLDPFPEYYYFLSLGRSYRMKGQYEKALSEIKKAHHISPDNFLNNLNLAAVYALLDRQKEAEAAARKALEINPQFSVGRDTKALPYKNQADLKLFVDALYKAGFPDKPSLPLPDKPSIAVLPFVNMSGDKEQEYFADGITDDLITAISKISGIFVISRNSVFTFKDKAIKIQQIARELKVNYVLEGSVRRAGDTIRVNAQLIDASTDHHLWAEKYDAPIEDIFSVQDNITRKIVSALSVKLTDKEQGQLASIETQNIQAYDLFLKGKSLIWQSTPESYAEASILLKKAIELDPNYSRAYAELAGLYWFGGSYGGQFWKKLNIDGTTGRQLGMLYLISAMKNPTPKAHQIAMHVALARRQFKVAAEEAQKAIELSPNDSAGYASLSYIYRSTQPEKAISYAKMEAKLDPQSLWDSLYKQGQAYFFMKNYEKAVELFERAGINMPRRIKGLSFLPAAYTYLGRDQDARRETKTILLKIFEGMAPPIPEHIIHIEGIQEPEMATLLINGSIKAVGLPATTDKYCRLSEDERLSVKEIKELVSDRTWTGYFWFYPDVQWWNSFSKDGINILKYGKKTIQREFGFEDDKFYVLIDVKGQKLKTYWSVYRNKYGNYEQKSEYVLVHETFVGRFSVQKK